MKIQFILNEDDYIQLTDGIESIDMVIGDFIENNDYSRESISYLLNCISEYNNNINRVIRK